MQKIASNYLNKKMPPIHEMNNDDNNQQWYVFVLASFINHKFAQIVAKLVTMKQLKMEHLFGLKDALIAFMFL